MAALSVFCFAKISNMRAETSALERQAMQVDRQIVQSRQSIQSLERESAGLTAPAAVYARAIGGLGMQKVSLAGTIRVGEAGSSVQTAALPGMPLQVFQ
ncbi:hypothetical protein HMPREF1249_1597 [Jonquetella sp. BV3C21]|nr:hypothetical protein HMPREF1249_1597 [Jonquetella sp. BV3C21]